jgi:nicotinamidase-related amidase
MDKNPRAGLAALLAPENQGEGYEVYAVTDASGGVSAEAHDMAVRGMLQGGVTPITWLAVVSEWQRDWAREERLGTLAEVLRQHAGGTAIALDGEMQLLHAAG